MALDSPRQDNARSFFSWMLIGNLMKLVTAAVLHNEGIWGSWFIRIFNHIYHSLEHQHFDWTCWKVCMRVLTLHLVRMVRFRKTNGIIGTMDRTWSCAIWILGFEVRKRKSWLFHVFCQNLSICKRNKRIYTCGLYLWRYRFMENKITWLHATELSWSCSSLKVLMYMYVYVFLIYTHIYIYINGNNL